jgi:hypothetical protein
MLKNLEVIVLPSANPIGEIGSGYPTNVYDGDRLSLSSIWFLKKRYYHFIQKFDLQNHTIFESILL